MSSGLQEYVYLACPGVTLTHYVLRRVPVAVPTTHCTGDTHA